MISVKPPFLRYFFKIIVYMSLSSVNTRVIKNCYDINKIKAEYERVDNLKQVKLRRIEDLLCDYSMRVMRMSDSDLKRKLEQKLMEVKHKLNYTRTTQK